MKTLFTFMTGLFGGTILTATLFYWLADENGKSKQYTDSLFNYCD